MQSKALKRWQKRRRQKSYFWALSRFHVKEVSFIKFFIKQSWFGWRLHTITTKKIQIIHKESHSFMKSCGIRHASNIHYSVEIIHSSGSWTTTRWASTLCCCSGREKPSCWFCPLKRTRSCPAFRPQTPCNELLWTQGRPDYDRQVN